MKVVAVRANNRKRVFEVTSDHGETLPFPYSVAADAAPTAEDPIVELYIDPEIGCEGFAWTLKSGIQESVLLDQVLWYNRDPDYMRNLLLFHLTCEAKKQLASSALSRREIIRRLGTSPSQFYRLIDTTNYRKTVDAMLDLLAALDCEVEFTVKPATR